MTYFTGDIHGDPWGIVHFCDSKNLTEEDIIVILGDVGANYTLSDRDDRMKSILSNLKPTIFYVHGNHEQRPENIAGYELQQWHGDMV